MGNETRRIMLVEDEKAIRDAVTAYLERENYWVTAIGDGQDACTAEWRSRYLIGGIAKEGMTRQEGH